MSDPKRDEASVQSPQIKNLRQTVRTMKRFIFLMFTLCPVAGVASAMGYSAMVRTYGTWDASKDTFNAGLIIYGLGVALPILSISCRLMIRMFFQNCEAIENQNYVIETLRSAHEKAPHLLEDVQKMMDKAIPISNNIEEIVARAKAMSDDVGTVAHKLRGVTDAMNGSFSADTVKEIRDSLKKIADGVSVFKMPSQDDVKLPEFDPLKPRRRRETV